MDETAALNEFNEYLDETQPEIQVAGMFMSPSNVLRSTDPIAYREAFLDWADYNGYEF